MKNGGAAFPQHGWSRDPEANKYMQDKGGMSLRDYFAAQSLSTIISLTQHRDGSWDEVAVAVGAYAIADAMLQARKQ
jgi:hypothetical protein